MTSNAHTLYSLSAGSPLSHASEQQRAKRESGEEAPSTFSFLAALPLDFSHALVLQRDPWNNWALVANVIHHSNNLIKCLSVS